MSQIHTLLSRLQVASMSPGPNATALTSFSCPSSSATRRGALPDELGLTAHTDVEASNEAHASSAPVPLKAIRRTVRWCASSRHARHFHATSAQCPRVLRSTAPSAAHSLTEWSPEQEASSRPSGLHSTPHTRSSCPSILPMHL